MEEQNNTCAFTRILRLIEKLQKNSGCEQIIDNTCLRPYLGNFVNPECYNTRPITFYGCNNNLISVEYTTTVDGQTQTETSSIFRVERVDNCCVLVSILIPNPNETETTRPYVTTGQTAIINLNCVCAIKCLNDTIVDL